MALKKTYRVTENGLKQLKEELELRQTTKKKELIATIEDMRDKGDLSENDGYTLSLEEFESNERRISELQYMIDNAQIIENDDNGLVGIGSKVKLKIKEKHLEFHIVGHSEANPMENKISEETPIGKALVGRKKGDTVTVELPVGQVEYEIVEVL